MSFLNNDFLPLEQDKLNCDRSMHWSDEDEYRYQQELKRKREESDTGLHFHDW